VGVYINIYGPTHTWTDVDVEKHLVRLVHVDGFAGITKRQTSP
jgi:hypothetical protein